MPPPQFLQLAARLFAVCVIAALVACDTGPNNAGPGVTLRDLEPNIPLPQLGPGPDNLPSTQNLHAIVQRIDVPLDQSTDDAWAVTDELVFPAITRSAWHANGLRLGLLDEASVEPFAQHMPDVLELYETHVYTSTHPMPIMRTPRLRNGIRIPIDLTLPPAPRNEQTITGGDDGKLQLLVRLETEGDKVFVVLTPHHFVPENNRLTPRDVLEKELDGRVYDELAVRVELRDDRLLIVGLYWPWPIDESYEEPSGQVVNAHVPVLDVTWLTNSPTSLDDDPAAPPPHLRAPDFAPEEATEDAPPDGATDTAPANTDEQQTTARQARIAPPLPLHFGRALLTGTRARKPVQTFLLISLPEQDGAEDQTGDALSDAD